MMRDLSSKLGVVLALLGAAACQPPREPRLGLYSATYPLEGPCPEDGAAGPEFTEDVERLRVRVTGAGIDPPIEAEGGVTTLSIAGVPVGEDRRVTLFGLDGGGKVAWRGYRAGVLIEEDRETAVDVLLSRVADLSCSRTPLREARAFHTATVLPDGRVLIVGGAQSDVDASGICPGCRLLTATGNAELYDPGTGSFIPAGSLSVPRIFHTATLLEDGRVAIAGGTSEALISPLNDANTFPFKPRLSPTSLVEIWDPSTRTFSQSFDDPGGPRMFHAAAITPEGALLLTGGIPGPAAVHDLSNALASASLCDVETGTCLVGDPSTRPDLVMAAPRAGHGAFLLESGDVLLWGGSTSPLGDGFKPEVFRDGRFVKLSTLGFVSNELNLFFAAMTRYSGRRVIAGGGLVREPNGTFRLAEVFKGGVRRGPVYVFDAAQSADGVVSAGPYVNQGGQEVLDALVVSEPRFFGAAAPLVGGSRAVLAGGFTSLDALEPSASLDLYMEQPLTTVPLTVGGDPRILRQSRAGLSASGVGDGTVLFVGGETLAAGVRAPIRTAEIFADPEDPEKAR